MDKAKELVAPHVERVQTHGARYAGQAADYGRSTQDAAAERLAQLQTASREQASAAYQCVPASALVDCHLDH